MKTEKTPDLHVYFVCTFSESIEAVSSSQILSLEGLAFYWNCGTATYGNLPTVDIIHHLTNEIATKTSQPSNYRYSKQQLHDS